MCSSQTALEKHMWANFKGIYAKNTSAVLYEAHCQAE